MNNIKWATEASALAEEVELEKFVFRNATVDNFLNGKPGSVQFIIASKGMGKTLLLHYKRHLCEESMNGALFLPSTHRMIEIPENIKFNISKEMLNSFENFDFCKRFWSLSLKLYVFSGMKMSCEEILSRLEPADAANFSRLLSMIFDGEQKSISFIVDKLLDLSYSKLFDAMNSLSSSIMPLFDKIHTSVVVFIDQLDQALLDSHKKIWITMQNGLLGAAWDIGRLNTHVKVFLSIRKEAYSFIEMSRDANAIQSSVAQIYYSKNDLKEMIDHLIFYYEKKTDLDEFLGVKKLRNVITFSEESVFNFMYRYSIGRPRDFVQMCHEISLIDFKGIPKRKHRDVIKACICETASDKIIKGLFEEQKMLLKCFHTEAEFKDFLRLINKNVYTYNEVMNICKQYNLNNCINSCENCSEEYHPFCDLYNMGLLGIIDRESDDDHEQLFKTPYATANQGLIESDYYLIHPALRMYIKHFNRGYRLVKGILVGHGCTWKPNYAYLYKLDKVLEQISDDNIKAKFGERIENYIKKRSDGVIELTDELIKELTHEQKKMIGLENTKLKIFISYAFDGTKENEDIIDSLREQLRKSGFEAEHYKSGILKNRDLDTLMKKFMINSDKIIVVLSQSYKEKADKGKGGVWREYQMIQNDIQENEEKYIFVTIDSYDSATMHPCDLGNKWVIEKIRTRKGFNQLLSFITGVSEYDSEIKDTPVEVKKIEPNTFFVD